MHGECPCVVGTEDVAAEGEVVVRQAKLPEQCGGQIALVTQLVNLHGLANNAACPYHGDVRADLFRLVLVFVEDAVVGNDDDQRFLPCFGLPETLDEAAYAAVEIVEGIKLLVGKACRHGHRPGFVRAQCEEGGEPWCRLSLSRKNMLSLPYHIKEPVEGDAVADTPFAAAPLLVSEVVFADDGLDTRRHEVASRIGEVGIAAIEERR